MNPCTGLNVIKRKQVDVSEFEGTSCRDILHVLRGLNLIDYCWLQFFR